MGRGRMWLLVALTVASFSLHRASAAGSPSSSTPEIADYCPLKVGNVWEYHYEHEIKGTKRSGTFIRMISREESAPEKGVVEYFNEKNKTVALATKAGILGPDQAVILRPPIVKGAKWYSGAMNQSWFSSIEDTGLSLKVAGSDYSNCIRVERVSEYVALSRGKSVQYTAFESDETLCPGVGIVLSESYEIPRGGERRLTGRSELVSFKQGVSVSAAKLEPGEQKLVRERDAFRYPERGFLHPLMSPDDRWIVYARHGSLYREMNYTKVDRTDMKVVPLYPKGENHETSQVNVVEWSPDGSVLALTAQIDGKDSLVLVDFTGEEPSLRESLPGQSLSSATWMQDGHLVYLDEFGNIMKKLPGKSAERAVFFRNDYRGRDYADRFQLAGNGSLVYFAKNRPLLTSLSNPNARSPVLPERSPVNVTLSPDGKHALVLLPGKPDKKGTGLVIALGTQEKIMDEHDMQEHAWSPDGSKLAFLEEEHWSEGKDGPSKETAAHFFVFDVESRVLRDYGFGVSGNFAWAPDSRHVLYSMKRADSRHMGYENGLFVLRLADAMEVGKISKIGACAGSPPALSRSKKYVVWENWELQTFFAVKNPLTF